MEDMTTAKSDAGLLSQLASEADATELAFGGSFEQWVLNGILDGIRFV